MSYRPYRLEIKGSLSLANFHLGTGASFSLTSDSPILRLPDGRAYLPATSLKGVLRSHLNAETTGIAQIFGEDEKDNNRNAFSRITVLDSLPTGAPPFTEVRDHVRIRPSWAAAEDGGKFDQEVATGAMLHFYLIYEGESEEDIELQALREAIRALEAGELSCGANAGRGYGRMLLSETQYAAFQRKEISGLTAFLQHRLDPTTTTWQRTFPGISSPLPKSSDPWSTLELKLRIVTSGPVLVRAAIPLNAAPHPFDPNRPEVYAEKGRLAADHVPVTTGPQNTVYLPGASLRGVLRHQAFRIAGTRGLQPIAHALFGKINHKDNTGAKGHIEISDATIVGPPSYVYIDHVAIDRITGFAADKKKFSTSALENPKFDTTVRIRFKQTALAELALLGFLLRDLQKGRLFCGAAISRGYGYIETVEISSVVADLAFDIPGTPLEPSPKPNRNRFKKANAAFADLNFLWTQAEKAWLTNANR